MNQQMQTAEAVAGTMAGERPTFTVTVPQTGDEDSNLILLVKTFVSQSTLGYYPDRAVAVLRFLADTFQWAYNAERQKSQAERDPIKLSPVPSCAMEPLPTLPGTVYKDWGNITTALGAIPEPLPTHDAKMRDNIGKMLRSKLNDETIK